MAEAAALLGTLLELDVGPVAHGGSCVARHEGRVVFVRHTLPGERVRAAVTEDRDGSYLRADAVEILRPAPERVPQPCPHARPGRCGGCDWQHATPQRQRELKADVIRDQFRRLARLDVTDLLAGVEDLGAGQLGWRTRITFAADREGRLGLHRHRLAEVELLETCPLGAPGVGDSPVLARTWPGLTGVEVERGDDGATAVLAHRPGPGRQARGRRPPDRVELVDGPQTLTRTVAGESLTVSAGGFWQVHPRAADAFAAAVLAGVHPQPGERVADLYCGAGALTAVLADAVGPDGRVLAVESNAAAAADAGRNLAGRPWVEVRRARVDGSLVEAVAGQADVIVLDPPRAGAGREVMAALAASGARAVAYVACDPAALARDARVMIDRGWRLAALRAFDAFPMTHHVECVASFVPDPGGVPG